MPEQKLPLRGKDIRKRNEKLILGLIQKNRKLSQSEAVNLTGLKPPTILRIFANLEEDGLIKVTANTAVAMEKKGRRPVFYKVNSRAAYAVGLDFCSTSASVVIVNLDREPVYSDFIEYKETHTGESVFTLLCALIEDAVEKASIDRKKILGIGVGAPGKVDTRSGSVIYYDRIAGLADFSLQERLGEYFDMPIHVNNNCSVIAANEYQFGIVSDSRSLITLLIRSGVGGAFISEGKVFSSNGVTAMEVGHISLDEEGRVCECGSRGCLQTYLAEPAILEDLKEIAAVDSFMDLDRLIEDKAPGIDDFIRDKAEKLCQGLKMLSRIFSPDTYLIISRSSRYAEELARYSRLIMKDDPCHYDTVDKLVIKHSAYKPINAGQGAADMVFADFFAH